MEYTVTTEIGDGLAEAPPLRVSVREPDELVALITDELHNDAGRPMGVGTTLTIERVS